MKRTPYVGMPDGEERDMVRMRGRALRLMHEHDAEVGGREPYDPADSQAEKVGHENPIRWVRATEIEVKEWKRKQRIRR